MVKQMAKLKFQLLDLQAKNCQYDLLIMGREQNRKIYPAFLNDFIEWTKRGETEYIKTKGTYKDDRLFGQYTEWWRPNHKKKECFYDAKGEFHGKMVHYEGFSVEEPTAVQFYKHGVRDSTWTWFYNGGKIKSIENYKNGKEHGAKLEYYENGNKKYEAKYLNDKKVGLLSQWYDNGQLRYTCEYTNNE